MMKKLIFIAILGMLFLVGCIPCKPCPPQKAYVIIKPYGPAMIPKGVFDDKRNWLTEDEFKELMLRRRLMTR